MLSDHIADNRPQNERQATGCDNYGTIGCGQGVREKASRQQRQNKFLLDGAPNKYSRCRRVCSSSLQSVEFPQACMLQ